MDEEGFRAYIEKTLKTACGYRVEITYSFKAKGKAFFDFNRK